MKGLKFITSLALVVAILASCANQNTGSTNTDNNQTQPQASNPAGGDKVEIHLVNGKIEIDAHLKEYAANYEKEKGVSVKIESLGGGIDIASQIKGYLASGNMPDIFVFGGESEYDTWKDIMADLSGEPWVADTNFSFKKDGKVLGFPYAVEGYGLTYNKEILDKAGVDPASLTTYDAYKAAFEKLDGMKEELGISAVTAMAAESGQMFWTMGNHNFNAYLAGGLDRDDSTYIDLLLEGKIDADRMKEYGQFVKLLYDYADPNILLSGTYDDQLSFWATGKAAFVHQGNWIDPSLPDYNVDFAVGMSPLAFSNSPMDGIMADTPSWWGVYKDSKHLQAAKDFLTDIAMTQAGSETLVMKCGMISPFISNKKEPVTPLAVNLMDWVQKGKTYSWQWTKLPESFAINSAGPVFEAFARGDVDVDGFVELMKNTIAQEAK